MVELMAPKKKDDVGAAGVMPGAAVMVVDHVRQPDGSIRTDLHGPSCARTREVAEAFVRGVAPPPARPGRPQCDGPPRVTTDAYREGWDTIFGGRQPRGEA